MSKELEEFYALVNGIVDDCCEMIGEPITATIKQEAYERLMRTERMQTIENGLKRLEALDNSKPNEALECLEKLELLTCDFEWYKDNIDTIKQALIQAEKDKRFRDIIVNKNVDIWLLKSCLTVEQYNYSITKIDSCDVFNLTEEEFNFLKEMSNNE